VDASRTSVDVHGGVRALAPAMAIDRAVARGLAQPAACLRRPARFASRAPAPWLGYSSHASRLRHRVWPADRRQRGQAGTGQLRQRFGGEVGGEEARAVDLCAGGRIVSCHLSATSPRRWGQGGSCPPACPALRSGCSVSAWQRLPDQPLGDFCIRFGECKSAALSTIYAQTHSNRRTFP
jgi:hypothetical protein